MILLRIINRKQQLSIINNKFNSINAFYYDLAKNMA